MNGNRYEYMISSTYCREWTKAMAVRELLANAIDAARAAGRTVAEEVTVEWSDGLASISNASVVLQKHHLLIGESEKTAGQIGQFGEGLKIAALVLARAGEAFEIVSGGVRFDFTMEHSTDFDRSLLCVSLSPAPGQPGTSVTFTCDLTVLNEARALFADFSPPRVMSTQEEGEVLLDAGDIYVLGVKVCTLDGALFGYNLADKALMNRDRTIVDQDSLRKAIREMWRESKDKAAIVRLLLDADARHSGAGDSYEGSALTIYYTAIPWEPLVHEAFGPAVCVTSPSDGANERARYLGFTVVNCGVGLNTTLTSAAHIQLAHQVDPEEPKPLDDKDLTPEQRKALARAKRQAIALLQLNTWESSRQWIEAAKAATLKDDVLEQAKGHEIWVNVRELRADNVPSVAATLIHALAHIRSGASDCSSHFEAMLTALFKRAFEARIEAQERKELQRRRPDPVRQA